MIKQPKILKLVKNDDGSIKEIEIRLNKKRIDSLKKNFALGYRPFDSPDISLKIRYRDIWDTSSFSAEDLI